MLTVLPILLAVLSTLCAGCSEDVVLFSHFTLITMTLHCYAPCTRAQDGGALTFTEAHVQQAVCSPSRTSLLTSRRPDHTRVYDLNHHFRDVGLRGVTTLPEYFKLRGYASVGMGKIFHPVPDKVTGLVILSPRSTRP